MAKRISKMWAKVLSIFMVCSFILSNACFAAPIVSRVITQNPMDNMALQSFLQDGNTEGLQKNIQAFTALLNLLTEKKYNEDEVKQIIAMWESNSELLSLANKDKRVEEVQNILDTTKTQKSQIRLNEAGKIEISKTGRVVAEIDENDKLIIADDIINGQSGKAETKEIRQDMVDQMIADAVLAAPEQKQAVIDDLKKAAAENTARGNITQEEADAIIARAEAKDLCGN